MTELTKEIINVMKRIQDTINKTPFRINRFEVEKTMGNEEMILIDIRREINEEEGNQSE